jgi:CP family cyanate transporter-like MFS transporter
MHSARGRHAAQALQGELKKQEGIAASLKLSESETVGHRLSKKTPVVGTAWAFVAIIVLSVNLRPSITALPPIFDQLTSVAHFSSSEIAILAALPVLCFSIASAVTPYLYRRHTDWKIVLGALLILLTSLLLRGYIQSALLPLTAVSAGAIGLIGALIPGLIKRFQPRKTGLMLGAYLLGLYGGAMIGSAAAVPLYRQTHGSLFAVLSIWSTMAAVALMVWLANIRRISRNAGNSRSAQIRGIQVLKFKSCWLITGFMGVQSLMYYASLSWLPTLLTSRGFTAEHAGVVASTTNIGGLAAAWVIPSIAQRIRQQKVLVTLIVVATVVGLLGVSLVSSSTAVYWCLLLGSAQGSAIGLALFFTIARTTTETGAASLSSMSQCFGYALASLGPILIELAHTISGSWQTAFIFLGGVGLLELVLGLAAAESAPVPI